MYVFSYHTIFRGSVKEGIVNIGKAFKKNLKRNLIVISTLVMIIGAVWLEKEHSSLRTAKLGIFIADKEMRNKGIGTKAITRYINENRKAMKLTEVTLNVRAENIRAIRCYEKCGFVCEQRYEKADGRKVMSMIKSL